MIFYIKLAWRNILRNKRRTLIACSAIGIGLASMIFNDAMMTGLKRNMISSVTDTFSGEAQIHDKDYRLSQENSKTVNNTVKLINKLSKDKRVKAFTKRVISTGTVSSASNVESAVIYGIDPENEKKISEISSYMHSGKFVEDKRDGIVIGKKLAQILEVDTGDRLVITMSKPENGEIVQTMFEVTGIFKIAVKELERSVLFIHISQAQRILGLSKNVHEIAVKFRDPAYAFMKKTDFTEEYSADSNEAANWPVLFPQMKMIFDLSFISLLISGIIIFGITVFGLINTIFMSMYERMFELGVLKAVGTKPGGIVKLVILEGASLGIISCIAGNILGFIVTGIFTHTGIDYSGIEFAGTSFHKLIYPVMQPEQFILHTVIIFLFTVCVSAYPAFYAGKIKISDALKRSM